mgnify:CR=1 FL=1
MSVARIDKWQNTAGVNYNNVLQTVSRTATLPYAISVTTNTRYPYPGEELLIKIKPFSYTSKFLIMASISIGNNSNDAGIVLTRNSNPINIPAQQSSRLRLSAVYGFMNGAANGDHTCHTLTTTYLDSPRSSGIIRYNVDLVTEGGGMYINRATNYANATQVYNMTFCSTLTVMELAQ